MTEQVPGSEPPRASTAVEVAAVLRRLIECATPLRLVTTAGDAWTTRLVAHDSVRRRIGFAADADSPQLQRLLDAGEASATGELEALRLRFDVVQPVLVHGTQGRCTLQAALPSEVLHSSRRASARVRPAGSPLAHLRHPDSAAPMALRVLDVSLGGCALLLPPDAPPLAPGERLAHVRLELDIDTRLAFSLELLHATWMSADGAGLRLGCRFTDPQPAMLEMLGKYLARAQGRQ